VDVIAGHPNTDFDAFASMLACRRLYPGAAVALTGSLNRNVREFVRLHADELELVDAQRIDLDAVTRLVLVEVRDAARLGPLAELAGREGLDVVLFDHHDVAFPAWLPREAAVLSEDGALTTTLVGILAEREIAVEPVEATAFALGIHEDTGSLTYPTATQRDAEALAWCLRHGASQTAVARHLHQPLAPEERELFEALLEALEPVDAGGVDVLVAAIAWPRYVDGVSNLAHKLMDVTDARALACLVEMEERVVAVLRSRTPEVDAAALARALGGDGHREAASATYHGALADARAALEQALPDAVRVPAARDLMSTPPRFVDPDDTVAHAIALCQRHRQSGVQVGSPDALAGVVTREDLDKAMGHGLANAPVKAVMSSEVVTCGEETPLGEVRRLVAESHAGRVPVLRDGRVVGVVTRGDVLRGLGEAAEERPVPRRDLAGTLHALPGLESVFEAIQAVGAAFDGVYLVGGSVRDLLLGEPNIDLDVAVEGDGVALGRALAKALGGRVTTHEKFGTAVVRWPGGRLDVATARTEFYDEPAALPTVEQATIRQDLFRRDFTINAMAVSLKGEDFGRLEDPFGGLGDLERRVIRVLHNLSFIDDPTRLFRAVRYENRYGFAIDGHTTSLARACVEMGLVGELSSARLRDELQALLSERTVSASIRRLDELGVARAIHPHLETGDETVELVERVDELRARYAPDEPAWRPRLAVLARRLPPDELYDWFERLRLRRRDADAIADAVAVAGRLPALLAEVEEPAEIRRLAEPHDSLGVLLALACSPGGPGAEHLRRYLDELRGVALEIDGADLAALGLAESPRVGEVLGELLRRKLNGDLRGGREVELGAARELLAAAPAAS
jgi:tRNA nucleotidyltransferase (CCA-adding enzyme)